MRHGAKPGDPNFFDGKDESAFNNSVEITLEPPLSYVLHLQ